MAYGVQVFDSSGNITLDISDTCGFLKTYKTASISANSSVNVTVPTKTTGDVLIDLSTEFLWIEIGYTSNTIVQVVNDKSTSTTYKFIVVNKGF